MHSNKHVSNQPKANPRGVHLPKYGVLLVEPVTPIQRDKELRVVCVRFPGIGAGHQAPVLKPQPGMELIREVAPIDGLASCKNNNLEDF